MKRHKVYVLLLVAAVLAAGAFVSGRVNPLQAVKRVSGAMAEADFTGKRATDEMPLNDLSTAETLNARKEVLLVNRDHALADDYQTKDLVNLYERKRSFQLASSDIMLEREVFKAANRMFAAADKDGVEGFIITSGYRTEKKQQELYNADTNGTAAGPGTSEHQTGLAFDVTAYRDAGGFENTPQFNWLIENCWNYGFILRYPEGKENITGFTYEPWHYRYVGVETALSVRELGCTLEEYLEGR